MRVTEDGVAAPVALVRAAAGGDEVDRAHAVMRAPGVDVLRHVDRLAIGPRQRVDVVDLVAWVVVHDHAVLVAEHRAGDAVQSMRAAVAQDRQQLLERVLALAEHHDVGAALEVVVGIVGALRAAEDHRPAMEMGLLGDPDHIGPGHEVGVHAERLRPGRGEAGDERFAVAERGVERLDVEAGALEVGADVQQPQRRVGLHDLALLLVFPQEVAMSQQEVRHRRQSTSRLWHITLGNGPSRSVPQVVIEFEATLLQSQMSAARPVGPAPSRAADAAILIHRDRQ